MAIHIIHEEILRVYTVYSMIFIIKYSRRHWRSSRVECRLTSGVFAIFGEMPIVSTNTPRIQLNLAIYCFLALVTYF